MPAGTRSRRIQRIPTNPGALQGRTTSDGGADAAVTSVGAGAAALMDGGRRLSHGGNRRPVPKIKESPLLTTTTWRLET